MSGGVRERRPLCIDLFCGLGGWTEGFLAEGWNVVGFDIERHVYGDHQYRAQLVLQDVRTIHGAQLKDADMIVASSPCQEFSYRAMPWKRAKALPPPALGMELFAQAARIQREASEAAGRYIPMIQENVRGAQRWVGRAQWHYGSYYLWGDVPALMPFTMRARKYNPDGTQHGPGSWFAVADSKERGLKTVGHANQRDGHSHTRHLTNPAEHDGVKVGGLNWSDRTRKGQGFNTHAERAIKNSGGSWFNVAHNTTSGKGRNAVEQYVQSIGVDENAGTKVRSVALGASTISRRYGSKSNARKAATAAIAKIPFPLARYIAQVWYPPNAPGGPPADQEAR